MEINLRGKKAIVTGGSGQLGRCIVKSLAECDADVAVHYHNNSVKAEELVSELKVMGRNSGAFQADITNIPVTGGRVMTAI